MKGKNRFFAILILLAVACLAGCTSETSNEETPESLITGMWISDEEINGSVISYEISSAEKVFEEVWSSDGTWASNGVTNDGLAKYKVTYTDGTDYLHYLSKDGSALTDEDGYKYVRKGEMALSGDDAVVGIWGYEDTDYDFSGSVTFKADGTIEEIWIYTGAIEFAGNAEDGGYLFRTDYSYDKWDSEIRLSPDGDSLTIDDFTLHKV